LKYIRFKRLDFQFSEARYSESVARPEPATFIGEDADISSRPRNTLSIERDISFLGDVNANTEEPFETLIPDDRDMFDKVQRLFDILFDKKVAAGIDQGSSNSSVTPAPDADSFIRAPSVEKSQRRVRFNLECISYICTYVMIASVLFARKCNGFSYIT
jgi:hypothetical protein